MNEKIIDATNANLGRLSSYVAKQLLLGEKIAVVNSDKAIILGNKRHIIESYLARRRKQGGIFRGPVYPSQPERIIKRTIRGMLPRNNRGKMLLKNVKCYNKMPKEYEDKKKIVAGKAKTKNFITLEILSREIGG